MFILFFVLLIMVLGGLLLASWKIRKTVKQHSHSIEHLQLTVVEMTRKQSDLSEKVQLANGFKNSSRSNFEKLNTEIFDLFDLLMKSSKTQSPQHK